VSGRALRAGGILAAGDGSRLREDGWMIAKPLVPVEGVPLIAHVIENFLAAGVECLAIIFNAREEDCARFVRSRFPGADIRILAKTTASSLESYREIVRMLPPGPALVSTVDAWCPRADFLEFARGAADASAEETVLAVTGFVSDEKPLWVRLDPAGLVTEIGGASGDAVTAGMYVFPERVRNLPAPSTLGRLREYLAWLVERGETVRGISIKEVVDVDRASDIRLAEALAASRLDGGGPVPGVPKP
jgi:NDP-sugar pyrophosphorylase family protein